MGIVSDYLRSVVNKQVSDNRLVVWFDPDRHYEGFVRSLSLPGAVVAAYADSFFVLRRAIEPHLAGEAPPSLLVYVPLAEEDTHNALAELTRTGVVIKPGQSPWQRNTRLSVIAKNALEPVMGKAETALIERQAAAGKLSLADLDRLGETGPGRGKGVILIIFDTGDPQQVALDFLTSDRFDEAVTEKAALRDLASILGDAFGANLASADTCPKFKETLARHVMCSELVASLRGELPPQLQTLKVAPEGAAREACVRLVRAWRLRRDLRESYAECAGRVENDLCLSDVAFGLEQIRGCETFLAIDEAAQSLVDNWAADRADLGREGIEETLGLIAERLAGFWAGWLEGRPTLQPRWRLLRTIFELLRMAAIIDDGLSKPSAKPEEFLHSYTVGSPPEPPWCLLDTHHRHLEHLCQNFAFGLDERHQALERLVARARREHSRVGTALADRYLRALMDAKFSAHGFRSQREVYSTYVAPALGDGKTAYMLVDALRFEAAREVAQALGDEYSITLECVLGAVPSITEVGMASLMPRAESGMELVAAAERSLGVRVDGTLLKDRNDRVRWLKESAGASSTGEPAKVFETKIDQLLSMSKSLKKAIADADLIVVTSQEIDALCESDSAGLAHQVLHSVLEWVPRAIRSLAAAGCKKIVFAADHGYLFGEELGSDMKVDPPAGETVSLHRRVWVGRGGSSTPAFVLAPASALGWGGDLQIAVPCGLAVFKVSGGSKAYCHGGASLPETAIPVGIVTPKLRPVGERSGGFDWTVVPGSKKLSTRFFTVRVQATARHLFGAEPPKVKIELRAGSELISVPVASSYGFIEATGDIELRPKDATELEPVTVTLMIASEIAAKTVSVHVLDAATGRELARLAAIEVALSI